VSADKVSPDMAAAPERAGLVRKYAPVRRARSIDGGERGRAGAGATTMDALRALSIRLSNSQRSAARIL